MQHETHAEEFPWGGYLRLKFQIFSSHNNISNLNKWHNTANLQIYCIHEDLENIFYYYFSMKGLSQVQRLTMQRN